MGLLDPALVYEGDPIPHAINQVNEVLAKRGFGEPMLILEPRDNPASRNARAAAVTADGWKNKSTILVFR